MTVIVQTEYTVEVQTVVSEFCACDVFVFTKALYGIKNMSFS